MYIFQPDRYLIDQQLKKIGNHINGYILDVGAGKFIRYKNYFQNIEKYVRLDIDPKTHPDILASAEKIPIRNNSVDSIVCNGVIGDIKNLSETILEFYRILKPGGKILITEYFMTQLHDEPNDFWRFTCYGLRELFLKCGFSEVFMEKRGGFFVLMLQNKIRYLIDKFNLYSHKWSRIFNPLFKVSFQIAQSLDKIDKSWSNKNYSIGWTAIFERTK